MADVGTLVLVGLFSVLLMLLLRIQKKVKNPLPGPLGMPLVGYYPFLTDKPYLKLTELSKKYGPVYGLRLGSRNVVVLCGFKEIKEAFSDDAFFGRPLNSPFYNSQATIRSGAITGLAWKEQRRFALQTLRKLGFGKTRMEEPMKEEIVELLKCVQRKGRTQISDLLAPSASNNIASLLFGKRMSYDDPKHKELNWLIGQVGMLAGSVQWQNFFPFIGEMSKNLHIGNRARLYDVITRMHNFVRKEVDHHAETFDPNNIRDFTDSYLMEIGKKPESSFCTDTLTDVARAFFGAGTEAVRTQVDWAVLLAAGYPDVQRKIQLELDRVLGGERFPSWMDRFEMPYTEATICEAMRWSSSVSINLMRRTLRDTELNGYFIPKNTDVIAVFYALNKDKRLWGDDVDLFRPERFLSEDGKRVVKPEFFIPFSIGKRQCPGKILGEIETFLYFTAILQKFNVSLPPGKTANLKGYSGIGIQPLRQELLFTLR